MSRAVITGAGVVSAFGVGLEPFWDALAEGRGAIGPIRNFDASAFATSVGGEVPVGAIDPGWMRAHLRVEVPSLDAWEREGLLRDRKVAFALLAAAEAWASAGCCAVEREASLSIALGMEHTFVEDLAPLLDGGRIDWARAAADATPGARFRSGFDAAARLVERMLGLRGLVAVHASACAGGALAIAHAASLIERGAASVVLCGASDSMLNPMSLGGMSRLGAPSPRNEPDACRPFDRRRDGLAMGEGAAMFVLESEERAAARRHVRPLARVLGWASTQDAWRLSAPRPDGSAACRAMQRALAKAGLAPERIGYVNAHGTGTPLNDAAEARAIRDALGEHGAKVPVGSIKGAVGHLMAASGAIELAACLLPFARGVLPGTAHHLQPDPECGLNVIGERPLRAEPAAVLSNSFGFGGQNACLILGRCG